MDRLEYHRRGKWILIQLPDLPDWFAVFEGNELRPLRGFVDRAGAKAILEGSEAAPYLATNPGSAEPPGS